jgi:hypothetical protein
MKQIIKQYLQKLLSDRYVLFLSVFIFLLAIICAINIGLSITPSDIKVVSHYSAFGISNYYRDGWLYLSNFIIFGFIVSIFHIIISIKLFIIKNRSIAIMFLWAGVGVILIGWVTFQQILNVLK